ncbi:hypothetical protein ACJ73_01829 [Blastomyces percursus]|uniref:Uncharacterized protein n=1 Tax=Blastomyces percursus TaxID=1658174 RepID=A0A1J9RFK6_9EURO|nr:hypothetical protein ACJ73_01829 [Blastomyces percursus]
MTLEELRRISSLIYPEKHLNVKVITCDAPKSGTISGKPHHINSFASASSQPNMAGPRVTYDLTTQTNLRPTLFAAQG